MTVHAVPPPFGGLTATCGERLGHGHTGHIPPLTGGATGWHVCGECATGVRALGRHRRQLDVLDETADYRGER